MPQHCRKSILLCVLQEKLELVTGAQCKYMKLEVYNPDDQLLCTLDDDCALLGSHAIDDGCRIHVRFKQCHDFQLNVGNLL